MWKIDAGRMLESIYSRRVEVLQIRTFGENWEELKIVKKLIEMTSSQHINTWPSRPWNLTPSWSHVSTMTSSPNAHRLLVDGKYQLFLNLAEWFKWVGMDRLRIESEVCSRRNGCFERMMCGFQIWMVSLRCQAWLATPAAAQPICKLAWVYQLAYILQWYENFKSDQTVTIRGSTILTA